MKIEKNIIAAVAEDGAIGRGNELLWHLGEDLKYFKRTTIGCPVIMGRRTFESIGRPLPGRHNIVISKTLSSDNGRIEFPEIKTSPKYVDVVSCLEEAFSAAAQSEADKAASAEGHADGDRTPQRCFIIGGAQLYAESIGEADRLYITHIHDTAPDADRFFPAIDPALWKEESRCEPQTDPESGISFAFSVYTRR